MPKATAAAQIRQLAAAATAARAPPARDKLLLLPRAELVRLCERFGRLGSAGGGGAGIRWLRKPDMVDRLLGLRWRGLERLELAAEVGRRGGQECSARSEARARAAMVRWLEYDDSLQVPVSPPPPASRPKRSVAAHCCPVRERRHDSARSEAVCVCA
jgi:hypothetical protein